MATPKKDLEISIAAISLDPVAFPGETRRLAEFRLVCPRLAVAQKSATKTLELDGGKWPRLAAGRWTDAILFKESVQGDFGIEIDVSRTVTDKDLENAAASTAATLLKLFGDLTAGAVGIKALNSFAELPATALAKTLTGSSSSAKTAASGAADVPGPAYGALKTGDETTVSVELLAARDIVKETRRANKSASGTVSRRTMVKKGDAVGAVTLRLKAL